MSSKNLFRNRFDHHTILGFIVLLLVILTNGLANADTLTWTNNGGSGFWHDDTNWNPERVPIDGDDVIIPVGTDSVTHSSGTTNLNSLLCSGNLTISNGILNFSSASSIDTGGTLNLSGGTLGGGGDITISGDFRWTGGTLTGSGTVTTSGVSTIGGFITLEGRKLINTGTATWSNIYFSFRNNAEIDNQSAITMDSDSGLNLGYSGQISGSFTNAGTVTISGGAGTAQFNIPLSNSGTVDIISGTLRLTTNTTNNGTIQGSGTLNVFGIEFTNAGNINPGTSSGILAINGNFQQSSTGALNTEFAGTDGSDYDQLNISGNLNLSGTLNLSLIEDFLPEDSNSFTIVIFSNLNGLFTQINWPALNPGLAWEYRTLASSIELYCGIDSDLDGLPDTLENTTCTMVNDADADADDLLDGQEDINKNGQKEPWETDPCDEDTDNDTMPDGWEVDHGLDPLDSSDCGQDPDDDLLTNCEEYFYSTDPNNADSDADGMPDGWEVDHNFDPLVDDALEDADQDGYSNLREYLSESDPRDHQDLPAVIADVDADNDCDGYDLAMFILEHGRDDCDTEPCDYDLDFDGDVDEIDLFLFSEDCGNIITPPNRAMKFWSAPGNEWGTYAVVGNIQKENEVISDFQNYHIKRVYGGYGDWITGTGNPAKNSTKKDQIAAWNLKLHNNGIESQVVFSRYSSIIPDSVDRQKLRASVLEVLNFNNSRSNPLEKFDGINLDLEPQALSGWDDGTADKKEYLNFLLDTYQDVRHHIMNNNGASQMPLYAQLGHHFDKMPEIGGKVNWSSEQARDDWFFAVKNTLSNITLMSYTLGSLDSIESTSQYERGIFENAEFCLNVKDIGTTWADLNEFMDMLNQIETNNHNLTGIHSFHHFKPYILQTNPPVADFIAITASGVSPLSVQFIDKSLNLPSSWAWDFDNDGTVESTDKNPLYVYSNPGIYTVKLTVTNENGTYEEIKRNLINVYDDPINEDLLLHYKLDADLRDETSNQFGLQHYTFSGSAETPSNPNFSSDALSGQSIYFDGNISKNALRGDNLRSNLLNGLTYIAWVKIPQNAIADGSKRGIVAQGLTPYLIKNKSGNLEARLDFMKPDNTEIKISIISAAVLPADQWAQVALTWYPANSTSEKNIALYIDGSKIDETNSPYVFLKPDSRLAIGKVSKSMYFFNGMIDEVKIYSTALTETQIQAEYQSQVD